MHDQWELIFLRCVHVRGAISLQYLCKTNKLRMCVLYNVDDRAPRVDSVVDRLPRVDDVVDRAPKVDDLNAGSAIRTILVVMCEIDDVHKRDEVWRSRDGQPRTRKMDARAHLRLTTLVRVRNLQY